MRSILTIFAGGLCVTIAGALGPTQVPDARIPRGSLAIRTLDFPELVDAARERRVPMRLHMPDGDGPFPLVIFSHGGAGRLGTFVYQATLMAGHGYASLCVEHVYSNVERVRELIARNRGGLRARMERALVQITTDPRSVLERPRDISFAIDRATVWNRSHEQLQGRIDVTKVAVVGHSYGAYTALACCGARPILDHLVPRVGSGEGLAPDLSDARITTGVAMSPQGLGTSRYGEASYQTIDRPLLCFSGTRDDQLGHDGVTQPAIRRLDAFRLMPPGNKVFLWLENADHLAFADNPSAYKLPSKARRDTQRIAQVMTLAWCDLHLKGKAAARTTLTPRTAASLCGDVVTMVGWYEK